MFLTLQVLSVCLMAVAMSLALAHALELPGKMRLDREAYLATQPIYYPGFTVGAGIGEGGGVVATLILLLLTPRASQEFQWTVLINGAAGVVVVTHGRPFAVMGFTVARDKIVEIDCLLDPERLARLDFALGTSCPTVFQMVFPSPERYDSDQERDVTL
jgi:hypothetical protein